MQSAAVATTEVTLPRFQYRYVGRMEASGKETVHFTKDDRLYSFTTGDTIDGVYRVDSITPQGVQLTYLPTNQTGPAREDDRRFVSGIIHMLQCGARWRG